MHVTIYEAISRSEMRLRETIPVDDLYHARRVIKELYEVEIECAEWNIRNHWVSQTYVEAHVYGFCRDEHVALVIEDDFGFNYLDKEWWLNELE